MKEIKKKVQGQAIRTLKIADLLVDESYQREVKKNHLKIIDDFDENALGTPKVGEREDGTLWVVDGLQRITALKKMGKEAVRCDVFNSRGPEHEAQVFDKINRFRTKLHSHEEFRSRLTAGDSDAWAVKKVVEECGFVLKLRGGRHKGESAEREVTCVGVLNKVYNLWGDDVVRTFLTVIKEAGWNAHPAWTNSIMVYAFCSWLAQNDGDQGVDINRLVRNMRTTDPGRLMYSATLGVGNRQSNAIELIAKLYRKRPAGKKAAAEGE